MIVNIPNNSWISILWTIILWTSICLFILFVSKEVWRNKDNELKEIFKKDNKKNINNLFGISKTAFLSTLASLFIISVAFLSLVVAQESLVVAQDSLDFSTEAYDQLLPQHQSKIVFSDSNVIVTIGDNGVGLQPVINNVGKGRANNFRFTIYTIFFNENIREIFDSQPVWDDGLINVLYPETSARFGYIEFPIICSVCFDKGNISIKREPVALIFHVEYDDVETGEHIEDGFWFKYTIGDPEVFSLTKNERSKIDTERLKELLKSDEYLLDLLE